MSLTQTRFCNALRLFFVFIFLIAISSNVKSQVTYYVKQTATGLNNGSSWANAFTSLTSAFSVMVNKDTVKVAKGIYTPGTNVLNSFQLKDSVIILGGYPDTGNPTDVDRSFSNFQSIMSGEIGVPNNPVDNIKIILQALNKKGFVVDGFIIENGYAGGSSELGPIYFTGSTGKIDHSVIRNNFNYWGGSAINAINTTATISNSFIENNATETGNSYGSVFSISSTSNIAPSNFTLVNNVIAKNKTRLLINQFYSTTKLVNCTVFKNYGFSWIHDTSNTTIQNSIFYRNGNNYGVDTAEFSKDVYSSITINNTITEVYNSSAPGFLGTDPKFADTANVAGIDGKYFTTDDGLRLLNPCSPAINAGNNSFVTGINSDIALATRIKNGIVDLGAYEVQETIGIATSVIYVKKTATGLNNGTSWQDAFTDLQSAFKSCSDTIKVAKGIYPVSAADPWASFVMNNHRVIIGGYPDFGSPTNNDINTELYPSKLDGMISNNLKCFEIVLSNNNDSTARMIGFEIMNSAPPLYLPYNNFGRTIKISHKSSPYFEKIKVNSLTNQSSYLLYISDSSKPLLSNCVFYNGFTSTGIDDGARRIVIQNNSEPKFLRSYFGKDTTAGTLPDFGAKLIFDASGGSIDSCTFNLNDQSEILNRNNSYTQIRNSLFRRTDGISIYNDHSTPVITNCIFRDTLLNSAHGGGAIYNFNGSDVLIDKCQFARLWIWNGGSAVRNINASATIKNSIFRGCRSDQSGGAIFNDGGKVKLINCVSYFNGGGYKPVISTGAFIGGLNAPVVPGSTTMINCTIFSASTGGGIVVADTLKMYNCILWSSTHSSLDLSNTAITSTVNDITTDNNNNAAVCDIRNSILFKQTNTLMTNSTSGINPRFIDQAKPDGPDNYYYTADDGLIPCTCSPAINAGNNSLNPEATDIMGANRVYNGTIDIGAYEVQTNPTTDKTFFVKENAAAGGNGISWGGAYNSLQKAVLNNCADTIKIAKGTYKPAASDRDSSYNVYRGITFLGGYPNVGNPTDANRDIIANPTILSGDIGIANDSTDNTINIMRIHTLDTTVLIDGITFERGNADVQSIYPEGRVTMQGGAIYSMSTKLLKINNCTFRNNYGFYGGAVFISGTTTDINKTEFKNNNALNGGGFYGWYGGAAPFYNNGPSLIIRNSVFNTNKGCAAFLEQGPGLASFENVVFYKNQGPRGAGVYSSKDNLPSFINCTFAKNNNTSAFPGIGVYIFSTNFSNTLGAKVFNCIFTGNTILGANPGSYVNPDFNWYNTSSTPTATIPYANLRNSAISTTQTQTNPGPNGNLSNAGVSLVDINNGAGADGLWMTADDGVRPLTCSNTIDKGSNTWLTATMAVDILDGTRIQNSIVDMGPYEGGGNPVNPIATITASDTTICNGTQVTFTATVTGTNATTVYQWMINGSPAGTNSATFITNSLANNDIVKVVITINNSCVTTQSVTSNSIVIHVSPTLTASVTISASANPSCQQSGSVTYTATPVNGGAGATYQWKRNGVNAGTNSPLFTPTPLLNNDVISCVMTSSLSCVTSNPVTSNSITQTVNPLVVPSVSVTVNPSPLGCPGSTVTFTPVPVNAGPAPYYQWHVNSIYVAYGPTFTSSTLQENDVVNVVMQGTAQCAQTSSAVSVGYTVHFTNGSVTPSVTISGNSSVVCPGGNVTYTASPVNGGTAPSYQWKVNGTNAGTNSATFISSTLNENDVVTVVMTSNAPCASTPTVTSPGSVVHFATPVTASVSVTSTTIGCVGTSITFTANPVNGGTAPSYQWKVNGGNVGTNSPTFTSSTLNENDVVTVVMTSNATCVTTAVVTSSPLVVHYTGSITASVGITSTPIGCVGSSITFTANPVNGGTAPAYQWKVNGGNVGTNSPTFTSSTLNENDVVTVVMTSNAPCVTTTVVTSPALVVHYTTSATASVSITSTPIGCVGTSITFTANPVNGGTTPAYQWKVNGGNVGTNSPTFTSATLNENDVVTVVMTSNASCVTTPVVTSPALVVHFSTSATASVSITSTPIGCAGSSITFTANPVNGGTAPVYQWKVNGGNVGTNSPTFTSSTLNENDGVTVVMTSNAACVATTVVTSPAFVVHFSTATTASVNITASTTSICQGTPVTFTAVPVNGGTAPAYQWQVNGINVGTNSNIFTTNTLTNNSQVKVLLTSNSTCVTTPNAVSNVITMNVDQLATPLVSANNNTFTVTNPDAAALYTWQVKNNTVWANVVPTATGISYTAPAAGEYRVKAVKGACTAYSASVLANIAPPPLSHFIYVHPNPADRFVTFDSINLSKKYETIQIIDMQGRTVMPLINVKNQVRITIDINLLTRGMYMAIFRQWDETYTVVRFIKQ